MLQTPVGSHNNTHLEVYHFSLPTRVGVGHQRMESKVGVPIFSARVPKSTPRIGGTYLDVFTWVYKSTYQGAFTVHSAANGRF